MSLPAPVGLVSFEEAFARARVKELPFDPTHIELDYDGDRPRVERARDANVEGPVAGIWSQDPGMAVMGYFRMDIIDTMISISVFRPKAKRSANVDEIIDFIGKYPEIAKKHRIVCLNSGVFGIDEAHMRLFGFIFTIDEKARGEYFKVSRIEQISRVLSKGDLVISKK